jgi:hypothetical protein
MLSSPAESKYQIPESTNPITPKIAKSAKSQNSKFEAIPMRLPDGKPYGFESDQPPPNPPPSVLLSAELLDATPAETVPSEFKPIPHAAAPASIGEKTIEIKLNIATEKLFRKIFFMFLF